MLRQFYQNHRHIFNRFDAVLLANPVLERGLVLAPIVTASKSVTNGLALSLAFALITFLTALITLIVPNKIPYTIRVIFNALVASLVFIPTAMLVERWFPGSVYSLGIYLPLLVTNSLIVQKFESRFHRMAFSEMLLQLFCNIVGFCLVAVAVGAVRELIGKGTLLGQPIKQMAFTTPAILLPCCGFILLGFFSALVKKISLFLNSQPKERKGAATDDHE